MSLSMSIQLSLLPGHRLRLPIKFRHHPNWLNGRRIFPNISPLIRLRLAHSRTKLMACRNCGSPPIQQFHIICYKWHGRSRSSWFHFQWHTVRFSSVQSTKRFIHSLTRATVNQPPGAFFGEHRGLDPVPDLSPLHSSQQWKACATSLANVATR